MSEDICGLLDASVREALTLRYGPGSDLPAANVSPAEVLIHLRETRSRQDRIEELLTQALRVRGRAQRAAQAANALADDAFDKVITANRTAPVQAGGEYSSARERTAEANLATLDARLSARTATTLAHRADEAVEVIRTAYRGIDGLRGDIGQVLRAMAFESHLER